MLVKICGITRASDADAAVEAGAMALGFVFWPASPRFVDPYRARAIVSRLPPFVSPVGVFVNQTVEHVNAVAALVGLAIVQLHGDENVAYAAGVRSPVVKAIPMPSGGGPEQRGAAAVQVAAGWPARVMLLLDVHDPERRGGTGRTVDWSAAASLAAVRPTILAGGLTPDNVVEAVTRVQPFGIDVSSGVERSPGIKDPARLHALFHALRSLDHERARAATRTS